MGPRSTVSVAEAVRGEVQGEVRGEVSVRGLSKSFALPGGRLSVLRGLDLDVAAGECLAVVGASGSGKITPLRVLAGLEAPDAGEVAVDGVQVRGVGPGLGAERAVIFQEPRLLPWLTVLGNVAFGLGAQGVPKPAPTPAPRSCWWACKASRPPSRASSRAAWRSARASRGPWPSGPGSCSSTSRWAPSTP